MAAGWPFFGQFIAHDITADRSPLGHRADPEQIRNFRTPRANLEGVYGAGPTGSPYLFEKDDPAKLLLGEGGHDVPRNHEGIALVGDQRNDTHLFMSQMQVGFIKTHNRIVDRLREDGVDEAEVFEEARRATTWHYQWVILQRVPAAAGRRRSWWASCSTAARPCSGRATIRTSPSSSPTPRTATGTARSATATASTGTSGRCPVFPDLIGLRRGAGRSRDRLDAPIRRSRATSPRSAPRRSTAGCAAR